MNAIPWSIEGKSVQGDHMESCTVALNEPGPVRSSAVTSVPGSAYAIPSRGGNNNQPTNTVLLGLHVVCAEVPVAFVDMPLHLGIPRAVLTTLLRHPHWELSRQSFATHTAKRSIMSSLLPCVVSHIKFTRNCPLPFHAVFTEKYSMQSTSKLLGRWTDGRWEEYRVKTYFED